MASVSSRPERKLDEIVTPRAARMSSNGNGRSAQPLRRLLRFYRKDANGFWATEKAASVSQSGLARCKDLLHNGHSIKPLRFIYGTQVCDCKWRLRDKNGYYRRPRSRTQVIFGVNAIGAS